MMAKVAHGHADDLASTLALTCTCPILIAPAMNNDMWAKPATQRNIAQLQSDNVLLVGPGSGWLSCGAVGPGRMAAPPEILAAIEAVFAKVA